jgi:hypothetical protein
MADTFKVDTAEFVAFYKALAQFDPELKKALRKRLIDLAKPVVAEVKAAELNLPSKGGEVEKTQLRKKKGQHLGFRASLAAATKADFNGTGRGAVLHVRVSTSRFLAVSGRPRTLPFYMEGRRKREWRHPVFGSKDVWVGQKPKPFLGDIVARNKPAFAIAIENAVNDVVKEIQHKIK